MHFKRLMQLKSPEHKRNWRNERYVKHKQAVRKLTLDASCCIGSLNCDRLVEEDQIAEGLTVGPARYAEPWHYWSVRVVSCEIGVIQDRVVKTKHNQLVLLLFLRQIIYTNTHL